MKKNYERKIMKNYDELENYISENSLNIREDKKEENLYHIYDSENKKKLEEIEIREEKKERKSLDRDIKINSKKIDNFGIKLIYHRRKDSSKEYRIFISYKKDDKLIRNRLRNEEIDKISLDEKKMIEYYENLNSSKEIKKILKIS